MHLDTKCTGFPWAKLAPAMSSPVQPNPIHILPTGGGGVGVGGWGGGGWGVGGGVGWGVGGSPTHIGYACTYGIHIYPMLARVAKGAPLGYYG